MLEAGFARLTPEHADDAVSWWFFRDFGDGFAYARGGRVRSAREARKTIRDHSASSHREHKAWLTKPTHSLGPEGQLEPFDLPTRQVMRGQR